MAVMAVALGLAACSTPQRRARRHQALFDSYPPEVRQSILNGQVQVGFTAEQVNMALGAPSRVWSRRTPQADEEIWSYGGGGGVSPAFGFGFGTGGFRGGGIGYSVAVGSSDWYPDETERVVFSGGRVVSVEQRQR